MADQEFLKKPSEQRVVQTAWGSSLSDAITLIRETQGKPLPGLEPVVQELKVERQAADPTVRKLSK